MPEEAMLIRKLVFMDEQGFDEEFDEQDTISKHIVLYNNENTPVATCRYFFNDEKNIYVVGRVAVLKAFRQNHYGALILREAEQQIRSVGGKEIRLLAQVQAIGFYRKQGFSTIGKEFLEEECPHIWMKKRLGGVES